MMNLPTSLMNQGEQSGGPGMGLEMAVPGLIGGAVNFLSQQDTNRMSSQIADRQMQFQQQMSNTAHQREVADLKAAGLNPILSAGGSGASTPAGAGATFTAPQISMPDFMAYGVSLKQLEQADAKLAIDRANSASQIAKNLSEQDINKMDMILKKQGLLGRELGTDTASKFHNFLNYLIDSVKKPASPSQPSRQPVAPMNSGQDEVGNKQMFNPSLMKF